MANAGRIVVDLQAGTSQFILDMDKANRKLNEFGHGPGVTNIQATSAALRVLEGTMTNNLRAAERFVAGIPGVGAALKAAFPVVGAFALGGILTELGEKLVKLQEKIEKIQAAATNLNVAFANINARFTTQNDELDLTNAKLQNEIDKLEGKPQNGLAVALAAARVEADKLAESLSRDLAEAHKVLSENQIGFFGQILGNQRTDDVTKDFQQTIQRLTLLGQQGRDALSLSAPGDQDRVQAASRRAIYSELATDLQKYQSQLKDAQELQKQFQSPPKQVGSGQYGQPVFEARPLDQSARIAALKGAVSSLQAQWDGVSKSATKAYLEGRKAMDEANKPAAPSKVEDYFGNAIKTLQAELQGATGKAGAAGTNPVMEALARGAAAATKQIEEINKELTKVDEHGKSRSPLSFSQVADISGLEAQISLTELAASEKRKQQEIDDKSRDERLKGLDAEFERTAKLTEESRKRQEEITKTVEKIRNETQVIGYQTEAIQKGGGRDFTRQADLAGIRAQGRIDGEDPSITAAKVQQRQAEQALQDAQRGVGQTALGGVKQYLIEMHDATISVGRGVHDVIGGAFEGLNSQLTNLIDGQKTNWSSFFRGIAAQIASISLNNIFSGLAGKALGGASGGGLFGAGASGLSGIFSLFSHGASGGGGGASSSLVSSGVAGFNEFGGFMAQGGPLSTNKWYIAGEHGPEPIWGGGSGAFATGYGGGGNSQVVNIDNRGAQSPEQVEMLTRRAARQAFQAGAQGGAALTSDRRSRMPRSKALYS